MYVLPTGFGKSLPIPKPSVKESTGNARKVELSKGAAAATETTAVAKEAWGGRGASELQSCGNPGRGQRVTKERVNESRTKGKK